MLSKNIVVLANSRKHGGHCVAGKCVDTGKWIRPVSRKEGTCLDFSQVQCEDK